MRMRNRNRPDAAARVHLGNGVVVEESDAIPEQISSGRLQEQSTLAYRKFRFGADPQKMWHFLFDPVVVISRQTFERRPFLSFVTNKLPFIFANGTAWRRLLSFSELRPALHADKILHRGNISGANVGKVSSKRKRVGNQAGLLAFVAR
jgi:hypothetical protein